jgi:hypothetical protein
MRWWEARRVPYNVIVEVVGLSSSAVMVAVAFTCESRGGAPIGLPDPRAFALVGVLLYGILANACYTGGWITELLVAKLWSVDTARFGPIAFTLGQHSLCSSRCFRQGSSCNGGDDLVRPLRQASCIHQVG